MPCFHSLRVRLPHVRKQMRPSTSVPIKKRGNKVAAVMNHVLLPGTRCTCSSTSDLMSGKLTPQNRFASSSITIA